MTKSNFSFAAPEDSPGFLLWQTSVLWAREIKKVLEPSQISHAQFVVMANCLWLQEQGEEAIQSDIVAMSKLDKMTVSKACQKLVGLGYMHRAESALDTRAKSVKLSKKGTHLTQKLVPLVEAADELFFSPLNKNEQAHFRQLMIRLIHTSQ